MIDPVAVEAPNWEGLPGSCEHRTVGPHRAWAYDCNTWCRPDDLCPRCDQLRLPERWRGLNVGDTLADLREVVQALRDNAYERALERGVPSPWTAYVGAYDHVLDLIDGKVTS